MLASYLLGNGYRAYNPALMRFNSPDNQSPFGEGGLNAYAYCAGDPVNSVDPSGHMLARTGVSKPAAVGRWKRLAKSVRRKVAIVKDATTFAKFFVELLRNPTLSNRWAVIKQTGKMAIKYGLLAPANWVYTKLRPAPTVPDPVVADSAHPTVAFGHASASKADVQPPAASRDGVRSDTA